MNLIEIQRQLPVRADFTAEQIRDDLLVSRAKAKVAFVPVLEANQFLAVVVPAAGFPPQFRGGGNRHQQLLGARPVHFFPDDLFHFADDPQTQWEIGIDAGGHLANQSGAKH